MSPHLTTAELAARVRKSIRTVERWRQINEGPRYIKPNGDRSPCLYPLKDVERWEQERYANTA